MSINLQGAAELRARLTAILSPEAKRRVMKRLAKEIVANSKKHIQNYVDLEGHAWEPRKKIRRRKMLARLGRRLKILAVSENEAVIGFGSGRDARIAAQHQFGNTQQMSAGQLRAQPNRQPGTAPATRHQASQLLALGYVKRLPGGRSQRPTMKWITDNMTIAQAGGILKSLSIQHNSWETKLPARSFLGVTDAEFIVLNELALQEMMREIGT